MVDGPPYPGFIQCPARPAAQTRLMLGKYLEFWVTDKKRTPQR